MKFSLVTIFQTLFLLSLFTFFVLLVFIIFVGKERLWLQAIAAFTLCIFMAVLTYYAANGPCSDAKSSESCTQNTGCQWNSPKKTCSVPIGDALLQYGRFPKDLVAVPKPNV